MANVLPHIEDPTKTTYLPPKGDYETFMDDAHYAEKVREWGLTGTKEVKREFWYKEATFQRKITIVGFQTYGKTTEHNTIVIQFEDGTLSCIHPAYLKEMQSPSFSRTVTSDTESSTEPTPKAEAKEPKQESAPKAEATQEPKAKEVKEKKEKPKKIDLPEDKVHFTAEVKQFGLSWNHFNEENDEVVILKDVVIELDNQIELGLAWCSHSKTLKKLELTPGTKLQFDGKVVKKKLPSGKDIDNEEWIVTDSVLYKINNPSKIKKS